MVIEFSLNVFNVLAEFSDKIFVTIVKGIEPVIFCVRDWMLSQCQQDTCEIQDL